MARKNQSAWSGMNFQQIMMQQSYQAASSPAYCRYCGHDIKQPTQNSTQTDTGRWYDSWELQNNAHYKCYDRHRYQMMQTYRR